MGARCGRRMEESVSGRVEERKMMDRIRSFGDAQRFVVATDNRDKLREIREILRAFPFSVTSMREAGFSGLIQETGTTFEENARIKALAVHAQLGGYVMADDSGLAVDALDGAPGVYSARFAGEDADYPTKIRLLWEM